MDDYLQLQQDSVACRVRAKRGCATHPRSFAERVSIRDADIIARCAILMLDIDNDNSAEQLSC